MAKDTIELIRQAEEAAEQTVRQAKQEAQKIVQQAKDEAKLSGDGAAKAAADRLEAVKAEAASEGERAAKQETERTAQMIFKLREGAAAKKEEAVKMMIHEII